MMNVLLVNTNRIFPPIAPIGLDYLADAVAQAGHRVCVLDLCFQENIEAAVRETLANFSPDVIGLTVRNTDDCYFTSGAFFLPEIKHILELTRSYSDSPIVVGGVGFSVAPEAVLGFLSADFGLVGSAEDSFLMFLQALERNYPLDRVPNLIFYRDGVTHKTNRQLFEAECTRTRSRSFVDNVRYFKEGGQAGFETKRGCDRACVYCADPVAKGRYIRFRPPKLVISEIKSLVAQGIDCFHMCDSEFNIPGEHAKEVCRELIAAGLGDKIRWYAYCSAVPFDREMADLLRRAGCVGVDFGVDSAHPRVLSNLGREHTPEDIEQVALLCKEHGITFMFDLLMGAPGETFETIKYTIEFIRKLEPDCVGIAVGVRVYEGTCMAGLVKALSNARTESGVYGSVEDNLQFLKPVFYVSPDLGSDVMQYIREVIGDDPRFFLPLTESPESNYNYNANEILCKAIRDGARGAYWDILRQLK
ncbi:MAG: B12-binding domain-containing radical SAM protein [Armatimonadota bacterium]